MNARQKAKKYKRQMEEYKNDAMYYKRMQARESFEKSVLEQRIKRMQVAQIIPYYAEMPKYAEDRTAELMSLKLGELLIQNKLVEFDVCDAVGYGVDHKKIIARLTVLEPTFEGGRI